MALPRSQQTDDPMIPLSWVRELLTSHEAVDRIAEVAESRPRGIPLRDALAKSLPYLGHVLEERAARGATEMTGEDER